MSVLELSAASCDDSINIHVCRPGLTSSPRWFVPWMIVQAAIRPSPCLS